jgi:hypothetical protein
MLMEVIFQSGVTPEQLQEAMSLLTARPAPVPLTTEPGSRRLPTWRSAAPYEGTTTVRVATQGL